MSLYRLLSASNFIVKLKIQWNLSKPVVLGNNFYVQNRQEFGLFRLNEQGFPTLALYLNIGLYRIRFLLRVQFRHVSLYLQKPVQQFKKTSKKLFHAKIDISGFFFKLLLKCVHSDILNQNETVIFKTIVNTLFQKLNFLF
jgi:hypothetical protein